MRDKDAHLIFESYKNRVILNEATAKAATALVEIPSTILTAIVGTAGAVVIGNEMQKTFDKLTGQEEVSYQKKVEQLKNILEKSDTSAKGCYELINFITSNSTDKTLIEFAQVHRQILDLANSLTENMAWDKELLKSLVFQAEGANTQLVNYVTQQGVRFEGKGGVEAFNRMLDIMGGSTGGGGGGGGGKPPKPPRGGWFAVLMGGIGTITGTLIASIWNKVTGANWKFLSLAALIVVSIYPELAKHFTQGLTQAGSEAIEGAKEGFEKGKTDSKEPTSPTNKWVPETPVLPKQKSTHTPEAAPTPFPFKRK